MLLIMSTSLFVLLVLEQLACCIVSYRITLPQMISCTVKSVYSPYYLDIVQVCR